MAGRCAVRLDERRIDAVFERVDQCHLPGVAAGLAIDGRPVYRKGFGLASMEQPLVLTPATRMRIFSVTKHFTALAYVLLCEEGRAAIDDGIGKYLPELHPVTHPVTMRQLMGNVGGLRDVFDITWQLSGPERAVSSAELLSLYRSIDSVNAVPGTAWIYNNGGWLILTAVIERITGQTLEDVLRERIFEPLAMHSTLLRRWETDFVPGSATLHMTDARGAFVKSYISTAWAGEAGIVSTVDDMLRWLAHMQNPTVGSDSSWKLIQTPQRLANGASTGYGCGLIRQHYQGIETLGHSGGGMGGGSHMMKVPAAGLDVVVISNREDVSAVRLAWQLLDECLPALPPRRVSTARRAPGVFRSAETGRVVQLFTRDGRQMAAIDGMEAPLDSDGDCLRPADEFSYLLQAIKPSPAADHDDSIWLDDYGTRDELIRQEPPDPAEAAAIVGHFRSRLLGATATIALRVDGKARLELTGPFGPAVYQLECLAARIWRARSATARWLGGVLCFERNGSAFTLSTYRTRRIAFVRGDES